jgi:hypothetical protein
VIESINDKIIFEINKIKNPNETIYEMIKICYLILAEDKGEESIYLINTYSWVFLQSNMQSKLKKELLQTIPDKDISKDLIDVCMPFSLNYEELKVMLTKINHNLVIILDFVKSLVDFNIKKNIVSTLYNSNNNKNLKVKNLQQEAKNLTVLVKESEEYEDIMQKELTTMLAQVYKL